MPKAIVLHKFVGQFGDVYSGDPIYKSKVVSINGGHTFNDLIDWMDSNDPIYVANDDTQIEYIIMPGVGGKRFCIGYNNIFYWAFMNDQGLDPYLSFTQIRL